MKGRCFFISTASITKEFVVKDMARYQALKEAVSQKQEKTIKITEPSNLEKGRTSLKSFSFR